MTTAKAPDARVELGARHAMYAYLRTFAHLSPNARRLLLGTLFINIGLGVFGVLYNLYLVQLGKSIDFIGFVSAVSTVGQAAVAPLVGWMLRRFAARLVLVAGASLMVVTCLLSAILSNPFLLATFSALAGVGFSVSTIPAIPYMMEHASPRERAHLFSAYFASSTIGSMVGSLLSGAITALTAALLVGQARTAGLHPVLIEERAGLVIGVLAAALGLPFYWRLRAEEVAQDSHDTPIQALAEVDPDEVSRRDVLVMLAVTAIIALSMGAIMPFFNVYFATRVHVGAGAIGSIYAVSGLVCTAAAFLAPVASRWGRLRGFNSARALTVPVLFLFAFHPGAVIAAAGFIMRNALGTMSGALENAFAMEVIPARLRAAVAGWRTFAFNAAWSLGSLIAGFAVARVGYEAIFAGTSILTAIGCVMYGARFRGRARPRA